VDTCSTARLRRKHSAFSPSAFSFSLSFPPPQMFAIAATGRLTADGGPLIAKPQNRRVPRSANCMHSAFGLGLRHETGVLSASIGVHRRFKFLSYAKLRTAAASSSCTSKTVYSLVIWSRSFTRLVKLSSLSWPPWFVTVVKPDTSSPIPELSI
jgi:hypothetical protein